MLDPDDLEFLIARDRATLISEAEGLAKGYALLAESLKGGPPCPSHGQADHLAAAAVRLAQTRERYDTYQWVSKQ